VKTQNWFEVDKKGLGKLLAKRGKKFILFELLQNAWDEQSTLVRATLERSEGRNYTLTVEDDNPFGFANLAHAFTLFAESGKKADAQKRGRFNLGEKLVLAICRDARISSTTGTVFFDEDGRHQGRSKTEKGSIFTATLPMTISEADECCRAVKELIVPHGVQTYFNGELLTSREPAFTIDATLPTEVADDEGCLYVRERKTQLELYATLDGEVAQLYEMGIPVVETGDRYHINVLQKVPLNFNRDNVPTPYKSRVRALALEASVSTLTTDDSTTPWVRDAFQKADLLSDSTINQVMELRYGDKRVSYDPTDKEGNNIAVTQG
jgi:hypothetical protein